MPDEGHWTGETVYQRKDGSRILDAITQKEVGLLERTSSRFDGKFEELRPSLRSITPELGILIEIKSERNDIQLVNADD